MSIDKDIIELRQTFQKINEDVSYLKDRDLVKYKVGLEKELAAGKTSVLSELEDVYAEMDKRKIDRRVNDMWVLEYKNMYIYKDNEVIDTIPLDQLESKFGFTVMDIHMMDPHDITNLFVKTEYPEATGWEIPAEKSDESVNHGK